MVTITRDRVPVSLYTSKGIRVAYLCHDTEWVPDSQRTACAACTAKFHVFNRKHHCRVCGEVICGTCSRIMAFHSSHRLRVCVTCTRSSVVQFTPHAAAPSADMGISLQTTPHPLYNKDAALVSAGGWSRSTAVIYATCLLVLVHVICGHDWTTTIATVLQ
ncbi:hypothetical protein H310_08773 [Aphanomyces invadans]|uniref:FYVE-type domain-containing protein n=1 Tax=Aphanomyces invadans TaxID=157072 RepID=A0A024TXB9_9STRA|nr:hypothetical protein H310_08773 [Aphanomyces invadans]ETV98668.1 hypothetical protein H310_08773 [Aphanomyces invadans]|eukprot:XP_008872865.1 hypothetical protein H310_08773 [Aphanomyces invadans]